MRCDATKQGCSFKVSLSFLYKRKIPVALNLVCTGHHLEVVAYQSTKWPKPGEQMALHIILIPGWSAESRPWGGNLLGERERKLDRGPRVWSTLTSSSSSINLKVLLHLLLSAFMVIIRVGLEVLCNQGTFCFNAWMQTTSTNQNFFLAYSWMVVSSNVIHWSMLKVFCSNKVRPLRNMDLSRTLAGFRTAP